MKVINLYGGPGIGKSTTASGLFYSMKKLGYKVEYVTEFAKDLVYQESFFRLKDQLMIFARQHHKLWILKDKVDYVIVDSPLLLSNYYFQCSNDYNEKHFKDLVLSTYHMYDNINIFLERSDAHPYQKYGREQTFEEVKEIDKKLKIILNENKISYTEIISDEETVNIIQKNLEIP